MAKEFIPFAKHNPAVRDEIEEQADDEPASEECDDHCGELPQMKDHRVPARQHLSENKQEQGVDQVEAERHRTDFCQEVFNARHFPQAHQVHEDEQRRSRSKGVCAPGEFVEFRRKFSLASQRQVVDADVEHYHEKVCCKNGQQARQAFAPVEDPFGNSFVIDSEKCTEEIKHEIRQ